MSTLPQTGPAPKPTNSVACFDRVQVWLKAPETARRLAELRRHCGRLHVDNRPSSFDRAYRQRLELKQPNDAALRWLAAHSDGLVNRLEVALDFVFDTAAERDDAFEFLHRHLVRRWHGKQTVRAIRGGTTALLTEEIEQANTRYDGSRAARNVIAFYREDHSRITGEGNCLHLEWRAKGAHAVRQAGVQSVKDLFDFDHRGFWQKRLVLIQVEPERLGRSIRNRGRLGRGRKDRRDGQVGQVVLNSVGSVQELIDRYGRRRIQRAFRPIEIDGLLPVRADGVSGFAFAGEEQHRRMGRF